MPLDTSSAFLQSAYPPRVARENPNYFLQGVQAGQEQQKINLLAQQQEAMRALRDAQTQNIQSETAARTFGLQQQTEAKNQFTQWTLDHPDPMSALNPKWIPSNPIALREAMTSQKMASDSLVGMSLTANNTAFNKALAQVPPEYQSEIISMADKSGIPNARQWSILQAGQDAAKRESDLDYALRARFGQEAITERQKEIAGINTTSREKIAALRSLDLRNPSTGKIVTEQEFVTRELGTYMRERGLDVGPAMDELQKQYRTRFAEQNAAVNAAVPGVVPAAPSKRVRVVGPAGRTGTIPEGTPLPDGWQLEQ